MIPAPRPVTPVGIAAATVGRLHERLAGVLDADALAELETVRDLVAGLDPYVSACTSPESPALRLLGERTAGHDWADRPADAVFLEQEMLSGHVEGQLLQLLVHATRARRVLEVGMFTGYSALAMAEALPEGGVVVACEIDPAVADLARAGFAASPAGRRIDVRVGPAAVTLTELAAAGRPFDVVFVDADKAGYAGYLAAVLDGGLLAPHGVLCFDNTLLQGEPYLPGPAGDNGRAIAAFNRALADDPRVAQVLVPLRDGLTLVRRVPGR